MKFHIVDVFAESPFAGNQLAVVEESASLSSEEMQSWAREFNFSETTFILSNDKNEGGYDVRIFTPQAEIPFAGHPTLGTAAVIAREIEGDSVDKVVLNLGIGSIPVTFESSDGSGQRLWMEQQQPSFGRVFEREVMAGVLGLKPDDFDTKHPISEVSTGLPTIVVPLKGLDAVRRADVDLAACRKMFETCQARLIMVFSPETYDDANQINARVFAHHYGVPEDPATGSANGCLAAYLLENLYFESTEVDARVEQGREVGRPSLLFLRASKSQDGFRILVGGSVVKVAEGELEGRASL